MEHGQQPRRQRPPQGRRESDLVAAVAKVVRQVYIHERQLYDEMTRGVPSAYNPGKQWDTPDRSGVTVWRKIAHFVLENHLEPETYIRRQFAPGAWTPFVVKPNQLFSRRALEIYSSGKCVDRRTVEVAFDHQQLTLKMELRTWEEAAIELGATPSSLLTSVLLNENLAMTALYRYCVAVREKLPRVADRYRTAAAVQYMRRHEDYDAVWGKLIPARFREEAKNIHRKALGVS